MITTTCVLVMHNYLVAIRVQTKKFVMLQCSGNAQLSGGYIRVQIKKFVMLLHFKALQQFPFRGGMYEYEEKNVKSS